jgi:hypothetical protein
LALDGDGGARASAGSDDAVGDLRRDRGDRGDRGDPAISMSSASASTRSCS